MRRSGSHNQNPWRWPNRPHHNCGAPVRPSFPTPPFYRDERHLAWSDTRQNNYPTPWSSSDLQYGSEPGKFDDQLGDFQCDTVSSNFEEQPSGKFSNHKARASHTRPSQRPGSRWDVRDWNGRSDADQSHHSHKAASIEENRNFHSHSFPSNRYDRNERITGKVVDWRPRDDRNKGHPSRGEHEWENQRQTDRRNERPRDRTDKQRGKHTVYESRRNFMGTRFEDGEEETEANEINSWLINSKSERQLQTLEKNQNKDPPPSSEEARNNLIKEAADKLKQSLLKKKPTSVNISDLLSCGEESKNEQGPKHKPYPIDAFNNMAEMTLDERDMRFIGMANAGKVNVLNETENVTSEDTDDIGIVCEFPAVVEVSPPYTTAPKPMVPHQRNHRVARKTAEVEQSSSANTTSANCVINENDSSMNEVVNNFAEEQCPEEPSQVDTGSSRHKSTTPYNSVNLSTPSVDFSSPGLQNILSKNRLKEIISSRSCRKIEIAMRELVRTHRAALSRELRRVAESRIPSTPSGAAELQSDDSTLLADFELDWNKLPTELISSLGDLFQNLGADGDEGCQASTSPSSQKCLGIAPLAAGGNPSNSPLLDFPFTQGTQDNTDSKQQAQNFLEHLTSLLPEDIEGRLEEGGEIVQIQEQPQSRKHSPQVKSSVNVEVAEPCSVDHEAEVDIRTEAALAPETPANLEFLNPTSESTPLPLDVGGLTTTPPLPPLFPGSGSSLVEETDVFSPVLSSRARPSKMPGKNTSGTKKVKIRVKSFAHESHMSESMGPDTSSIPVNHHTDVNSCPATPCELENSNMTSEEFIKRAVWKKREELDKQEQASLKIKKRGGKKKKQTSSPPQKKRELMRLEGRDWFNETGNPHSSKRSRGPRKNGSCVQSATFSTSDIFISISADKMGNVHHNSAASEVHRDSASKQTQESSVSSETGNRNIENEDAAPPQVQSKRSAEPRKSSTERRDLPNVSHSSVTAVTRLAEDSSAPKADDNTRLMIAASEKTSKPNSIDASLNDNPEEICNKSDSVLETTISQKERAPKNKRRPGSEKEPGNITTATSSLSSASVSVDHLNSDMESFHSGSLDKDPVEPALDGLSSQGDGVSILQLLRMTVPMPSALSSIIAMDESRIVQRLLEIDGELQRLVQEKLELTDALKQKQLQKTLQQTESVSSTTVQDTDCMTVMEKRADSDTANSVVEEPPAEKRSANLRDKKRKSGLIDSPVSGDADSNMLCHAFVSCPTPNSSQPPSKKRKICTSSKEMISPCYVRIEEMSPTKVQRYLSPNSRQLPLTPVNDCLTVNQNSFTDTQSQISSPDNGWTVVKRKPDASKFENHMGSILDIIVHKKKIIAASEDGKVYVFSKKTGKVRRTFLSSDTPGVCVTCLCLVPHEDQTLLFTGTSDGKLRCFDFEQGDSLMLPVQVSNSIQCMDYNWKQVFLGAKTGCIVPFSTRKRKLRAPLSQGGYCVLAIKSTMEGPRRVLIVASRTQPITIRDATSGLYLRSLNPEWSGTVYTLVLDASLVYCGSDKKNITVFDFQSGRMKCQLKAGIGIVCMKMYRGLLFAASYDGKIYVYDSTSCRLVTSIDGPGTMVLCLSLTENKIIAGCKGKQLIGIDYPRSVISLLNTYDSPISVSSVNSTP